MLITCTLIAESRRMSHTGKMFGTAFPFRLEPTVYAWAERLSPDYTGGYWHFYSLANGGFYLAPASDQDFRLSSPNGITGTLTPGCLRDHLLSLRPWPPGLWAKLWLHRNLCRTLPPAPGLCLGPPGSRDHPDCH
jgi:hypothetical protein